MAYRRLRHRPSPFVYTHLLSRHLQSIGTTRQGTSIDVIYDAVLKPTCSPDDLVKTLYRIDGLHAVELRRTPEPDV